MTSAMADGEGHVRVPRAPRWRSAAAVIILALAGFAVSLLRGVGRADESWFLQVVDRVLRGDVLYREVFFGATPLSVAIAVPLARLAGTEILLLKALVAGCFALSVVGAVHIAGQLGFDERRRRLAGAAVALLTLPLAHALYEPLAALLALLCCSRALAFLASGRRRTLVLAAVLAAGCFAAKQNVGIATSTALIATLAARPGRRRGDLVIAALVFLASTAVALAPVVRSGAAAAFLELAFLGKRTYLELGRVSYVAGLARGLDGLPFLVPPIALVLLGLALVRRRRKETLAIAAFAGAGFAGVFPRADVHHLIYALPLLVVGACHAWDLLGPRLARPRLASAGIGTVLVLVSAHGLAPSLARLAAQGVACSELPHFRGALFGRRDLAQIRAGAGELRAAAHGEPVFLVSPCAGFHYLLTGIANPTRFDYPALTTFGRDGEAPVAASIAGGQLRAACIDRAWNDALCPRSLVQRIATAMVPAAITPLGIVYRARSPLATRSGAAPDG